MTQRLMRTGTCGRKFRSSATRLAARKALAGILLLLGGCASVPTTFDAYSVPLTRIQKNAEARIPTSGFNWKMESYLQVAGQLGAPDFADRYTLFLISCGTGCTEYAVIDRVSGEVHPGGMVTVDFPTDYKGPDGLEYRRNSRLLIVHEAEGFAWPVYSRYYVWDGTRMKLTKTETKRSASAPADSAAPRM